MKPLTTKIKGSMKEISSINIDWSKGSLLTYCFSTQYWSHKVDRSKLGRYIVCLLGFFLSTFTIQAQEALDSYMLEAMENNPGLKASFGRYQIEIEKINQVGSLQDPEVNMGFFLRPMELLMGNQRGQASIMQMFPWFGMLQTQKDEATKMAEAAYEGFRNERNQIQLQVKELYFQLQLLDQEKAITVENLELLKQLEVQAISRFQGGNAGSGSPAPPISPSSTSTRSSASAAEGMAMGGGSAGIEPSSTRSSTSGMNAMGGGASGGKLSDILRLQMQILGLESELIQLDRNRNPFEAKMNQLLGREKGAPVAVDPMSEFNVLVLDEDDLLTSITTQNPMLLMLDREGEAYRLQGQMAKLEGRPMFGAGLNYMVFSPRGESGIPGEMGEMAYMPSGMGNNMVMPMVTMTLPIYRKKYKSAQTEAEMWRNNTQLQKKSVQQELETELVNVLNDIRNAERRVELLREQQVLLEQTLDISLAGYATDSISFEEILGIQKELLDLRLGSLNARIDQLMGKARLEVLIGI
jgi:outer membrane protein TolC